MACEWMWAFTFFSFLQFYCTTINLNVRFHFRFYRRRKLKVYLLKIIRLAQIFSCPFVQICNSCSMMICCYTVKSPYYLRSFLDIWTIPRPVYFFCINLHRYRENMLALYLRYNFNIPYRVFSAKVSRRFFPPFRSGGIPSFSIHVLNNISVSFSFCCSIRIDIPLHVIYCPYKLILSLSV